MKVALFYMPRAFGGGSTSVTVHLFKGLQLAGYAPVIYRVVEKEEPFTRMFQKYEDVHYRNVSVSTAMLAVKQMPSLMTAACHSKHLGFCPDIIPLLMHKGMRVVTYDPNEFSVYDHLEHVTPSTFRPIVIRPTIRKQYFPKAVVIPSPYHRHFLATRRATNRPLNAVSIARVTFVKRCGIILDANRLLPKAKQCKLRGAENRLYTKFKLSDAYPEFFDHRPCGFPARWGAAAEECARANYAVDMTYFPNDGGGAQYSAMEAWDAGAVNIIHRDWLRYGGEMVDGKNCIAIKDAADLATRLRSNVAQYRDIVMQGFKDLKRHHNAEAIAELVMQELNR